MITEKKKQRFESFEAHAFAVDLDMVQMWQSNSCMLSFNSINQWGPCQLFYYELQIIYIYLPQLTTTNYNGDDNNDMTLWLYVVHKETINCVIRMYANGEQRSQNVLRISTRAKLSAVWLILFLFHILTFILCVFFVLFNRKNYVK